LQNKLKVTLQNKLMLRRTRINKELSDWIAKPVRSHKQVMEYCERLELLLSMKERANGYKLKSCDEETAINVVNAQLGNDIDLNLLLTRLGNIFPPQDDPADDNSLHAAMIASASHAPQPQRRNEPKTRPADIGIDKSHRGKRKQEVRDTYSGEISTLDRILRSLNDVKSEVGGFRKLLLDHGFTQEYPTPSTSTPRLVRRMGRSPSPDLRGKRNVLPQLRKPRPRIRHPGRCNHSHLSGKNYLLTVNLRMMSALTWHRSRKLRR
jgi:hypothetical protein